MKGLLLLTSLLIGESLSVPKNPRPEPAEPEKVVKPVFHDKLMTVHHDIETRGDYNFGRFDNPA